MAEYKEWGKEILHKLDWKVLYSHSKDIYSFKDNILIPLENSDILYQITNENLINLKDKSILSALSKNPNAIELLRQNIEIINWVSLSYNSAAMHFLEKQMKIDPTIIDKVYWTALSANPNAIPILEKFPDKIVWDSLSTNPNAIPILEENMDKIVWDSLCANPNAIEILQKFPDKINWKIISANPSAIHILEENTDKICWRELSRNRNAIDLLEENLDKIDWNQLSGNPNAIHLLEQKVNSITHFNIGDKVETKLANSWFEGIILQDYGDNSYLVSHDLFESRKCPAHLIRIKPEDSIDWYKLSSNPNAIHLLEENLDKTVLHCLAENPNAIHIIEIYILEHKPHLKHKRTQAYYDQGIDDGYSHSDIDNFPWYALSRNPHILKFIKK